MAAKMPTVGIDHPTVKPTNFDSEEDGEATEDHDSEK
jgi:hypothetical protein